MGMADVSDRDTLSSPAACVRLCICACVGASTDCCFTGGCGDGNPVAPGVSMLMKSSRFMGSGCKRVRSEIFRSFAMPLGAFTLLVILEALIGAECAWL